MDEAARLPVLFFPKEGRPLKNSVTATLIVCIGVACVHAQQQLKMTFSGTGGASSIDLKYPNTSNSEDNFAGDGSLGQFTFRDVRAINSAPSPSITCSGPNIIHFSSVAGGAVFRFQDGSLLKLNLIQADDCIDLKARVAHCTMNFQIIGGTGRFENASGSITLSETPVPLLTDASNSPVFFASTGTFDGTISAPGQGGNQRQLDSQ
jgi:hypothetical protein